jgi:hypothetical protein
MKEQLPHSTGKKKKTIPYTHILEKKTHLQDKR